MKRRHTRELRRRLLGLTLRSGTPRARRRHRGDVARVTIQSYEGRRFALEFPASSPEALRPVGMVLYGVVEVAVPPPRRRFEFAPADEDSGSQLDIVGMIRRPRRRDAAGAWRLTYVGADTRIEDSSLRHRESVESGARSSTSGVGPPPGIAIGRAIMIRAAIRVAGAADAPAIAAVQVASWQTTYPGIVAQSYIDGLSVTERTIAWERRMRSEHGAAPETVVAEIASGAIVGFASGGRMRTPYPGFDAELHAIYLLSDVQRQGLGRRLTAEWAKRGVARGFHAAIARVLADNTACRFYERLGARWVKEGSLELGGQPYPEVWYGWDDLRVLAA